MRIINKKFKKILIVCFTIVFAISSTIEVYAIGSYNINGKTVKYTDFSSSPDECWVYANNIYKEIWGTNFTNSFSSNDNMLRNLSDGELTLTVEHLKMYISNAALGSCLRICNSNYLHGTDGWGHSQIIVQKDANGFAVLEGGLTAYPYCREKYYTWNEYCNTGWLGGANQYIKYIKWPGAPAFSKTYDPEGCLDIVSGGDGTVYVRGWVFDRDNLSSPVEIHVYVGGVAGSGAYGVPGIIANTYRPDVDSAFSGVGQYHGFDATIDVPVTGDTTVYVYAINIGGGTNPEIGHLSTHINPKPADTTPPTISNVKISNVSSSGYTVTCKVTDEGSGIDRVQFPTWFENNNPYEYDGSWKTSSFCTGKINGNTVTYRVNTKDYSSKTGLYHTDIYAWDKSGNQTSCYSMYIVVGNKTPYTPVATKIYNGHTYQVFDKKVKWAQASAYCQSLGGHLVTVTSSGENNIVKQLVNAVGGNCFIGGTDEETEGTWKWCTGEKMNYTNWAPNEPNNFDNQDYMQMYSDGTWDDLGNQNESIYFICEYDSTYKVSLSSTELAYTGKARKPAVTVKDVNGKVISSSNYKLTYSNNTKIGQATVKVTFTGSKYSGSVSKTFYIVKANNKITVNDEFTKTAKSSSQSFKLGAKATGGKLTYASDNDKIKVDSTGKVTIAKNYSGSAAITIKAGNSNYKTVTKKVTITVKPAATTLKSVKNSTAKNASKGKLTVTWNKLSYVTGYQIQYSTSSSFKSGNKTVNVKGASSVSKAITGLAKNKTYYVRIRTYKTIEGKKVYSSWSAKKSVKIGK